MRGVKHDDKKPDWSLLPLSALRSVVEVLTIGAGKYAPDNWKYVEPHESRYFAATMRHLEAWQSGERVDPETGRSHLAHACCCLIFLLWFEGKDETESNN